MWYLACLCLSLCLFNFADGYLCDFDSLPLQTNFDMKRFLGVWYEDARTELQWSHNTWHSSVWNIIEASNGTNYFQYTGHSQSSGCSTPETGFFTETGHSAQFVLTPEAGRYELSYNVVYTDYHDIALVYMCYEPLAGGKCSRNKMHVSFLARRPHLSYVQWKRLVNHLDNTCITEADVIKATMGLCIAPTADPILGIKGIHRKCPEPLSVDKLTATIYSTSVYSIIRVTTRCNNYILNYNEHMWKFRLSICEEKNLCSDDDGPSLSNVTSSYLDDFNTL